MKTSFVKIVLFVCAVLSLAGCKKDETLKNLNVAAVQTLYEPVANKSIVLQSTAGASIYFEWEPALSEDGTLTLYQVAFDKVGGDFSNPLFVVTADGNGANSHATITHKQINKIAAMAGILSSETGKLIWTVIASKGVNPKIGTASNTLEVTRLAGFADMPVSVFITGEGSESGASLSNAGDMKSLPDGIFEIFTQLTAGKTYFFTDGKVGSPRIFYTNDKGTILEGTTVGNSTSTVATTGVYRIDLDFSIGSATMTQITKVEFFFCPLNEFQFSLDYVANGVWTAKSKPITFKQESWGRDQRYKFRMTTLDTTGAPVYQWWGAPASLDSTPTGLADYYYLLPLEGGDQWNNKYKFAAEMDMSLIDMSVIMSAGGAYTHSVTRVGAQ